MDDENGDITYLPVSVKCPYCGWLQTEFVPAQIGSLRPFVVLCDIDSGGGCDRYYVAQVHITATSKTYPVDL